MLAPLDLPLLLESVSRLFYENTTGESYATMFFAVYDNSCRGLRFVNCGHVAPLPLRVQRLHATPDEHNNCAEVVLKWEGRIEEVKLYPGDVLIICTDGVTEAPNAQGEEYDESASPSLFKQTEACP